MSASPVVGQRPPRRLSRARFFGRASFRNKASTSSSPSATPSPAPVCRPENDEEPSTPSTPRSPQFCRPPSSLYPWHQSNQQTDDFPSCPDAPFPPSQVYNSATSCVDENTSNVSSDHDPLTPGTAELFSGTPRDLASPSVSSVSSPLNFQSAAPGASVSSLSRIHVTRTRLDVSKVDSDDMANLTAAQKSVPEVDEPTTFCFPLVSESDADVPTAPFSSRAQPGPTWAAYDERVRALEDDLILAQQEAELQRVTYEQRNTKLELLVEELRTKLAVSEDEVKDVGMQLKETRLRMGRRIREMETELEAERNFRTVELDKQQKIQSQLHAEVSLLRGERAESAGYHLAESRSVNSSARASSYEQMSSSDSRSDQASAVGDFSSARTCDSDPLKSDRREKLPTLLAGELEPKAASHDSTTVPAFQSSTPLSWTRTRSSPHRIMTSSSVTSHRRSKQNAEMSCGDLMSPRAQNRKDVARRALLHHLHGSSYRNMRAAWYDFFAPHGTRLTSDKFAAALRSLPTCPVDLRDRELEELRNEVSANAEDDVITWTNFVRFYQRTKHEVSLVS